MDDQVDEADLMCAPKFHYIMSRSISQVQAFDMSSDILQMAERFLMDDQVDEADLMCAPKLMEVVLQNCRGRVDACIAPYLQLSLQRLSNSRKKLMQVRPHSTMATLHRNGSVRQWVETMHQRRGAGFCSWQAVLPPQSRDALLTAPGDSLLHQNSRQRMRVCLEARVADLS